MSPDDTPPHLHVVKGDASPDEVAALVVVLLGNAAAGAAPTSRRPHSEWSAHHRKVRPELHSGPAAWRSSALPR